MSRKTAKVACKQMRKVNYRHQKTFANFNHKTKKEKVAKIILDDNFSIDTIYVNYYLRFPCFSTNIFMLLFLQDKIKLMV